MVSTKTVGSKIFTDSTQVVTRPVAGLSLEKRWMQKDMMLDFSRWIAPRCRFHPSSNLDRPRTFLNHLPKKGILSLCCLLEVWVLESWQPWGAAGIVLFVLMQRRSYTNKTSCLQSSVGGADLLISWSLKINVGNAGWVFLSQLLLNRTWFIQSRDLDAKSHRSIGRINGFRSPQTKTVAQLESPQTLMGEIRGSEDRCTTRPILPPLCRNIDADRQSFHMGRLIFLMFPVNCAHSPEVRRHVKRGRMRPFGKKPKV